MAEWRDALRVLRREPGFALLAAVTMALGTAAVAVLFTLTDAVLLKPLPWSESARLVRITESRQGHAPRVRGTISNATFNAWNGDASTIEAIGGWRVVTATLLTADGEPIRLQTAAVTPSLFHVLRAQPHLGRLFVDDDGRAGGSYPSKDFLVLSFGFWEQQFGARPEVIGSAVTLSGRPHTIIGVMPREFAFPDRATRAWTPWAVPSVIGRERRPPDGNLPGDGATSRRRHPGSGLGRGHGPRAEWARSGFSCGGDVWQQRPARHRRHSSRRHDDRRGAARACHDVRWRAAAAGDVDGECREPATGPCRDAPPRVCHSSGNRCAGSRLTRQLAAESLLLGIIGGGAGFAFAAALTRALPSLLPADFPRIDDVVITQRTVVFSATISLLTGISCSLLPALHARRLNVVGALSDSAAACGGIVAIAHHACPQRHHDGPDRGGVRAVGRRGTPRPQLRGAARFRSRLRPEKSADRSPSAAGRHFHGTARRIARSDYRPHGGDAWGVGGGVRQCAAARQLGWISRVQDARTGESRG